MGTWLRLPPSWIAIPGLVLAASLVVHTPPAVGSMDTDRDGLLDSAETGVHGTDPNDPDSDDDQLLDGFEVAHGRDPLNGDENGNGVGDARDDDDSDGVVNLGEQRAGTAPNDPDTDDDGALDGEELEPTGFERGDGWGWGVGGHTSIEAADLDGDMDTDLVLSLWYWPGPDYATPTDTTWFENTDGLGIDFRWRDSFDYWDDRVFFRAADMDGDGDVDLVSFAQTGGIHVFENADGLGSFVGVRILRDTVNRFFHVDYASLFDLDGDGDLDVVSPGPNAWSLSWHENRVGAEPGVEHPIAGPCHCRLIAVDDLDGDGDGDVVALERRDNSVLWFENTDGMGAFDAAKTVLPKATYKETNGLATADLDGDGDIDVLFTRESGWYEYTIYWAENTDGLGNFGAMWPVGTHHGGLGDAELYLTTADLDWDGDPDVIMHVKHDMNEDVAVWHENLDGQGRNFGPAQTIHHGLSGSEHSGPLTVADMDGDAMVDVLIGVNGGFRWYEQVSVSDPLDPASSPDRNVLPALPSPGLWLLAAAITFASGWAVRR